MFIVLFFRLVVESVRNGIIPYVFFWFNGYETRVKSKRERNEREWTLQKIVEKD